MIKTDQHFMNIALRLARKGIGFTSPNPMVGAVVVKDGKVVGKGYHQRAGSLHAEINALNDAGELAIGADLYVTLEPCNHQGRTPPCTKRILQSKIKKVVMAMKDPNPHVRGGGADFLKENGIIVVTGICEDRAIKLNEAFIKFIKTNKPFTIIKCAITLDGRIAASSGDARWISGQKSLEFVHNLRHSVDAIMVGIGTVLQDNPSLTTRLKNKKTHDPLRVILDSRLSIPENAKVLHLKSDSDTLLVVDESVLELYPNKVKNIRKLGAKILTLPSENGRINLNYLMDHLGAFELNSLLIEGGSHVIWSALQEKIVDKINFFYAPKILGGDDGVPVCAGKGSSTMAECLMVKNTSVHRFDNDIMIEGYL